MIGGFDSSDSLFFRVSRQHESLQKDGVRDGVACQRGKLDGVVSGVRQLRQPLPNRFRHNPRHRQRSSPAMLGLLSLTSKGGEGCGSLRRIKSQA